MVQLADRGVVATNIYGPIVAQLCRSSPSQWLPVVAKCLFSMILTQPSETNVTDAAASTALYGINRLCSFVYFLFEFVFASFPFFLFSFFFFPYPLFEVRRWFALAPIFCHRWDVNLFLLFPIFPIPRFRLALSSDLSALFFYQYAEQGLVCNPGITD